jgi:hypothetical protein
MLLKRAIEDRLRKIVEQEVQAAVMRHLEALQDGRPAGSIQIVIGEVYNVAERFDGVVRIDNDLHLEEGAVSVEPVALGDPSLDALISRAQARLKAVRAQGDSRELTPRSLLSNSPQFGDEHMPTVPKFDVEQRLLRGAAERYREELARISREDQVR